MKGLFGEKKDPDQLWRDAIRRKRWGKAIAICAQRLQQNERDFALWNLVGDLHENKGDRIQAVEAWRRSLDGYALEGMHENVLGIGRKILRNAPEEEDVHLLLAEAYLNLERYADGLGALRSYLKLVKHRSENDLRALFRHFASCSIPHLHLVDELCSLYEEAGLDDIELEQRVKAMSSAAQQAAQKKEGARTELPQDTIGTEAADVFGHLDRRAETEPPAYEGMLSLESAGANELPDYFTPAIPREDWQGPTFAVTETPTESDAAGAPSESGSDHYDLGNVYREMKLWDAAIAEFRQAQCDPALRLRASLALADCYVESNDLQAALILLESEAQRGVVADGERLNICFRLGEIHELLGNLEEALDYFQQVYELNPDFGDTISRISGLRARISNG